MSTCLADIQSSGIFYIHKMLKFALCVLVIGESTLRNLVHAGGHEHGHHVIIHVPYKIKTIHHTHTITKHVHHKDDGDNYELLGYTVGHPMDLSGHGHDHGVDGGVSAGTLDGHNFQGGHDFGGSQEFHNADWAGGMSDGIKDSGYEGNFEGGAIARHDYHQSGHQRFNGPELSNGIYAGHGDLSTHQ